MIDAANLQLGDHVCRSFDNDEASRADLVAFTNGGIDARQRVLLFTHSVHGGHAGRLAPPARPQLRRRRGQRPTPACIVRETFTWPADIPTWTA